MMQVFRVSEILFVSILITAVTPVHAQVVRQLTQRSAESFVAGPALDDAGTLVTAATTEETDSNPYNEPRLSAWSLPGAARTEVFPFRVHGGISLSDDGLTYAFVSREDLTGQNPDGGYEIYVASADGTTIVQITERPFDASPRVFLELAGSGGQLLYIDQTDPLGTNPDELDQLFMADSDGTGLVQLTDVTDSAATFCGSTISDDGQRIVFGHRADLTGENPGGACQLFRVDPDGAGLAQLTTGDGGSSDPRLSGSGESIAYVHFDPAESLDFVSIMEWAYVRPSQLVAGYAPTITDDGQWIYYIGLDVAGATQVFRIRSTGASMSQVTDATNGANILDVVVSGDDTRLAYVAEWGTDTCGDYDPDELKELITIDPDGANEQQLTDISPEPGPFPAYSWEPDITPDGQTVVFSGLFLNDTSIGHDLGVIASDGTGFTRLTQGASIEWPGIQEDGTITFSMYLFGCPPYDAFVHRAFRIEADGSGFSQVMPPECTQYELHTTPAKRSDFLTFQGGPWTEELYFGPLDGSSSDPITSDGDTSRKNPRIDYDAEWVVYHSGADGPGSLEVYRVRTDGTQGQQLSYWYGALPDLSADGSLVVYESFGNPLGQNADGNSEIFLYRADTQATEQLTVTSDGENEEPRISGNGAYVYFTSTVRYFDEVPGYWHLYRIELATGKLERADGLADPAAGAFTSGTLQNNPAIAVDESGDRVVFTGHLNSTGMNGNLASEVFFADFTGLPQFEISRSSPTVLRWEPDPRGVRYDVIRGDLANLAPGAGTIELGPVVCLADSVTEPASTEIVDHETPSPGQGFFFLYRWSDGTPFDPGSWGQGTGGDERTAGAGECGLP